MVEYLLQVEGTGIQVEGTGIQVEGTGTQVEGAGNQSPEPVKVPKSHILGPGDEIPQGPCTADPVIWESAP